MSGSDAPTLWRFDGATYIPERDQERLSAQMARVRAYMSDAAWHTLAEISSATGDPEASISARLRDLRKSRHGSRVIARDYLGHGLYAYRLEPVP